MGFLPAHAILWTNSTRFAVAVSVTPVTIQELNDHSNQAKGQRGKGRSGLFPVSPLPRFPFLPISGFGFVLSDSGHLLSVFNNLLALFCIKNSRIERLLQGFQQLVSLVVLPLQPGGASGVFLLRLPLESLSAPRSWRSFWASWRIRFTSVRFSNFQSAISSLHFQFLAATLSIRVLKPPARTRGIPIQLLA